MKHVEGKVAFITGGASGIGFGMAQVFLKAGMKVIIADVLQERLDEAARHPRAEYQSRLPLHPGRRDRSKSDGRRGGRGRTGLWQGARALQRCRRLRQSADESARYEDWDWVLGVNLGGVVNGVVSFLPTDDRAWRGRPHRQHVVDGRDSFRCRPRAGIYATSKFAVRGLTDSLRLRSGAHNIGVSVLCPGMTRTHILEAEQHRPGHEAGQADEPAGPDLFNPRYERRNGSGRTGRAGAARH